MKRPIKEEYNEVYYYVTDLQKYCDELEKENKQLQNEVDYYKHEYYSECDLREKLEKALDKACEELENLSYVKGLGQVGKNFKEWKEWCLKDVE